MRYLVSLVFLLGCVVETTSTTRTTPTTPPPGPQGGTDIQLAGEIHYEEMARGTLAAEPEVGIGYAFTARAGATVQVELGRATPPAIEVYVHGPVADGARIETAPRLASGLGPHVLTQKGTYVLVVANPGNEIAAFELTMHCPSGECRAECAADHSCPSGSGCMMVQCATAPCPSYCEPFYGSAQAAPGADGAVCGTRGAARCQQGLYCDFPLASACGETDAGGRCSVSPTACTREYRPVCGCDGRTYPNACGAHASSVSVRSDGACEGDVSGGPVADGTGHDNDCEVGGCNSEVCHRRGVDVQSACVVEPAMQCYGDAVCEPQRSGECGWTMNDALRACLAQYAN